MDAPNSTHMTTEFRAAVDGLIARLGSAGVRCDRGWNGFAAECGFDVSRHDESLSVIGSTAFLLKFAAGHSHEFGFVVPIAQSARPWQRATSWRDDATLDLWRDGWSPVALDRVTLVTDEADVEFVIGNARPTPTVSTVSGGGSLAFDDHD